MTDFQGEMNEAVDRVLNLLEQSGSAGVEIDPLATILDRMKQRGTELDLSEMPPIMRMLMSGMGT